MKGIGRYLAVFLAVLLAVCAAALSGSPTHAASGRLVGCTTPSPLIPAGGSTIPQVRGAAPGGELWAVLPYPSPEPAYTLLKIVFYMTGSGPLHLSAVGPGGRTAEPSGGPDLHGPGSGPAAHPGDNWGSEWVFNAAGCWRLHAQRTDVAGNIWLDVAAPSLRIASFSVQQRGHPGPVTLTGAPVVFVIRVLTAHTGPAVPTARLAIRESG